jgi:hypothetical protein
MAATSLPPSRRRQYRKLALACIAAPLLLGFPMIDDALRDPATIRAQWDVWLIFFALPFAAALILLGRSFMRTR